MLVWSLSVSSSRKRDEITWIASLTGSGSLMLIGIYEVLIIILLLNYIIIIIGRMLSHTSYAQRCLSGVSVASERKVRTSVQYRLPAIAISVASKYGMYISSVLRLRVHACIWQYTSNCGTCCFKCQRTHAMGYFKGQRCKYPVIFQLFY